MCDHIRSAGPILCDVRVGGAQACLHALPGCGGARGCAAAALARQLAQAAEAPQAAAPAHPTGKQRCIGGGIEGGCRGRGSPGVEQARAGAPQGPEAPAAYSRGSCCWCWCMP